MLGLAVTAKTLLAWFLFLAFVGGAVAGGSLDPKQMVLRLQDMPTGSASSSGTGYKDAAAAANGGHVSVAQFKKWGYVIGYEADFSTSGSVSDLLTSASQFTSSVSVYRSSFGAAESLADSVAECHKATFKELSVGAKIGDEAHLCSATQKNGNVTAQIYAVLWRHGRLRGSVLTGGVVGGTSPTQAVKLAQTQDKRMG
jgi:hypothetical protein